RGSRVEHREGPRRGLRPRLSRTRDPPSRASPVKTYASRDALAALYKSAGVPPHLEVITYCGRGYGAACGLLALKTLGYERVRLYDGSWAEWSADPDLPVEIAPAPAVQPRAIS